MATPKGWAKIKPKTKAQRTKLRESCGKQCFLAPDRLAYPICRKCAKTCSCKPDCKALQAAYMRAKAHKNTSIVAKSVRVAKRNKCEWVKGK